MSTNSPGRLTSANPAHLFADRSRRPFRAAR